MTFLMVPPPRAVEDFPEVVVLTVSPGEPLRKELQGGRIIQRNKITKILWGIDSY